MIINLICRQLARRGLVQSHFLPSESQWALHSRIFCFFSRDETDDADKKVRPHRQFFQKNRDRDGQSKQNIKRDKEDISMILKSYRLAVPDTRNHNEIFSDSCKKLSSHYRQETHEEYVGQKEQLNKILIKIPELDFQTMTLIELLNILDFLRITTRIEGLNRLAVEKDKQVLFGIVNRYITENPSLPLSEIFIIFCKLTPLNYPDIHYMAELVLEHLEKEISVNGKLPFAPFQHFVMVKALSKKTFLSFKDKQIFQLIIKDLAKRQVYDKKLSISLFKALVDLNIKTHIADHELLKIIDNLLDGYLAELDGLRNIFMLKYLTECQVNECTQYYSILKTIYSRLLINIETSFTIDLLNFIINIIKHLKPSDTTPAHQRLIISNIIELHTKGTRREWTKLQFQIIELINMGFFREEIQHLNQLIEKPSFQFSWTLPYSYSQAGLKFLPGKIIQKGDRVSTFRENSNFVKSAVSIAIQSRLQPENAELKALHERVIANIKESTWTSPGYNWLSHIGLYHPDAIKTFSKEYGHLFNDKIMPEKSLIEQNFNLKIGNKIDLLSYWQYFFLVNEFDENCPSQLIFSLAVAPISLCAVRQYNKTKLMADKKSLLLASLYVKLHQCQTDPSGHDLEFCFTNIINLMIYYLQLIHKADDAFLQIYLKSAMTIGKHYENIKKNLLPHANFLLMTLLTLEDKRIKNSKWIRLLIEELSKNPTLFAEANNHVHFQNTIIRVALNKNLLSDLSLAHIKTSFFSKEEKLLIQSVLETFEFKDFNEESLIPLLKSAKLPEDFMKKHGEQFEKMIQNLPFEALQQSLIHFSIESGVDSDKMLLRIVSEFIQKMDNQYFDYLSVINNIHDSLNRISTEILQKLLKSISELLRKDLKSFLLVDHHQILTFLSRYNVEAPEYLSSVLDYTLKTSQRGTALIDILYEMSRNTLLPDPKIDLISNISMFNLSNYLKLLCLYEDSVPVLSLFSSAAKTQIELVPNSLLIRYIELKYKVSFRKRTDEEPLLALPNDLGKQFMMVLGDCGVAVKIEEIGDDRAFLLGKNVVVVFIDGHRTQEVNIIEKAMKMFYPERELIVKDVHLNRLDIEQFLQELGSGLSLGSNEVNTILTQWTSF